MSATTSPVAHTAGDQTATPSNASMPSGPKQTGPDDLTAIGGLGITAENRLYRAGIRSFGDLAKTAPERLEKILGAPRPGVSYERWIANARALCS